MKNVNLLLNIVLLTAITLLFILYFNIKNTGEEKTAETKKDNVVLVKNDSASTLKLAYVNVDTLLLRYKLADELQSKLLAKQKQMEANLNRKSQELQKEAAEFQKKVQTNSFLSMESAKSQEQELYQKQQKLLELRDKLSQEIMNENQKLNQQLLDSVLNFLEEFNKKAGYSFILNSAGVLYAQPYFDITDTVVKALNFRYDKAKNH